MCGKPTHQLSEVAVWQWCESKGEGGFVFNLLEDSGFTMLCSLLLHSEVDQPHVHTYPLPLDFPSI